MFDFHKKFKTAVIPSAPAMARESQPKGEEPAAVVSVPAKPFNPTATGSFHAANEVIKDFGSVPKGAPIVDLKLTSDQRIQMVAIETSPKEAVLLIVPEYYGAAPSLDLRRQLITAGYVKPQMLRATADVIAHVYATRNAANLAMPSMATKPEQLITEILKLAMEKGASDIHIETRLPSADVFFRIDGHRRLMLNLTYDTAKGLAHVLYLKGEEGSKAVDWNSQVLADCGISWLLDDGQAMGVRFSSLPIHPSPNFHFVLRIQSLRASSISIAECGYTPGMQSMIDTFLGASTGMTVICGPTNSGKSLSLAGCMRRVYEMRGQSIKQITAESPVENVVDGACQVAVGGQLNYAEVLKGILRQDADVVVPGEIRDAESASVVRDMVLGGRKVLTTLHTYSALGAYVRLREMGVPWDLLTMPGFINGVIYQRLVPTLCKHCRIPLAEGRRRIPGAVYQRLAQVSVLATDAIHVRGDGCDKCDMSGISGRTVVAEFLVPDRRFLELLSRNEIAAAEQHWLESKVLAIGNHGVTALSHAISKMHAGLLDPADVEHNVALLTSAMAMADARSIKIPVPTYYDGNEGGYDASAEAQGQTTAFRKTGT